MRRKIFPMLSVLLFVVLVAVIIFSTGLINKYKPSDEKADINAYFGNPEGENAGLTVDNQVMGAKALILDETAYVDYEVLTEYINGRFYWDANENLLLYTLPTDIISTGVGSKDYYVTKTKQTEPYVIVKANGPTTYVALDFIQKYTDIEYEIFYVPVPVVNIKADWNPEKVAEVKKDTEMREKGGIKSPILKSLTKKDMVAVLEEGDKWIKAASQDGVIGYIKKSQLTDPQEEVHQREFVEPEFTNISKDYTINMAWHQVTNQSANNDILETIAKTKGLTTLSPTWFSISDNEGNITSLANAQYVNYAHQSNIEVWGLVDNFTEGVSTHEVLSYTSKRERLSNLLIAAALENELDGINIDFEEISEETGDSYVQFIREMSVKCRNNGLVLSVDNYVPKNYTNHYNRREQGVVADYVVVMGYDEHYSSSKVSGSVASIGFVREGIANTVEEVPPEKVINAIPFYTRLWKETPKSEEELAEQAGTEEGEYTVNVKLEETFGMSRAESHAAEMCQKYETELVWDEEAGQYYLEYEAEGAVYKMWLEEERSIEEKLKCMKEYNLAGVAEWKLGFEKQDIWETIIKYVN